MNNTEKKIVEITSKEIKALLKKKINEHRAAIASLKKDYAVTEDAADKRINVQARRMLKSEQSTYMCLLWDIEGMEDAK